MRHPGRFAYAHPVAIRYGRLWRQGIPYTTMMVNGINHPNAAGLKIFVDALKALF